MDILLTWTLGLLPAVFFRYGFYKEPIPKRKALWVTGAISFLLIIMFSYAAHSAGAEPNMGPVALMAMFTYWILVREGKVEETELEVED